jgi:hypothetical protein
MKQHLLNKKKVCFSDLANELLFNLTGHTHYVRLLATLANGNLASGSYDYTFLAELKFRYFL